ncbi:hypothetical protein K461DRAFT_180040 [Myriangium duriaei CBS 260.36]|uniref:Uncharacterized protein n=1 Tax=Myriangium duriaei CBS 260.36 TaxID=1168546 RepID=A0A9P4MF46_9PEZI|nr:hypothetical protein K461DRAFT_180040 [Myriangium duriaei CBS 260.36]
MYSPKSHVAILVFASLPRPAWAQYGQYDFGTCSSNLNSIVDANVSATYQIPGFTYNTGFRTVSKDPLDSWNITIAVTRNETTKATTSGTFLTLPASQDFAGADTDNIITCGAYMTIFHPDWPQKAKFAASENGTCASVMSEDCRSLTLSSLHSLAQNFQFNSSKDISENCEDLWRGHRPALDEGDQFDGADNGACVNFSMAVGSFYQDNIWTNFVNFTGPPHYGNDTCPAVMERDYWDGKYGEFGLAGPIANYTENPAPKNDSNYTAYDHAVSSFNVWVLARFVNQSENVTANSAPQQPVVDVSLLCPVASNIRDGSRRPQISAASFRIDGSVSRALLMGGLASALLF